MLCNVHVYNIYTCMYIHVYNIYNILNMHNIYNIHMYNIGYTSYSMLLQPFTRTWPLPLHDKASKKKLPAFSC
jgi:hypothetical protein